MVLVELPFLVRPHVPDRPRRMLIHQGAAVPGAPPEQQATAASLNLLQWNTCLGKEKEIKTARQQR
jgi:hypothetical protein